MSDLNKLSRARLAELPSVVSVPNYDCNSLTAGIIHVGIGNFHRAHQAHYLHRLFQTGSDRDWAIIGAGVKHFDTQMRDRLQSQDWLTTIVELDPEGLNASVIGSMTDFVEVDSVKIIDAMARPEIRIVSLTVTEGGYFVDAGSGGFDGNHPEIIHDMNNPEMPQTVFGMMIAALRKRRAAGIPPFTIMSCDNLPENGLVARNTVLGIARGISEELHGWISDNVSFPNSMVDCITPATGDRERKIVREKFGIEDAAPVVCEPFRQWVLEDKFTMGRPRLENVGVEFVDDVAPYELMKLRILNGGHAAIAYPAGLLGIHYVHEAMDDPSISAFLTKLEHTEIIPTVPIIDGVSREAYFEKIIERFSNEAVGDTIQRLCFDGSNRQPKFILPTIEARLANNESIEGLALVSALWCRYCYGYSDEGREIAPNDPNWEALTERAKLAKKDPGIWLEMAEVYGTLASVPEFRHAFEHSLTLLWDIGTRKTLDVYVGAQH